jgi:PilZ domain-containing protein
MSSTEKTLTVEEVGQTAPLFEERRSNARLKILKSVRIRHLDSSHEEVGTITNLSRDGINFIVRSRHYQIGMDLRLTLPYAGSECTGQVVRIQQLENGRWAIGARILSW